MNKKLTKKQYERQFKKKFDELHGSMGVLLDNAGPIATAALAAVCSDALVYCMWKITNGDMDETAKAVSRAVNISLEATRKNL